LKFDSAGRGSPTLSDAVPNPTRSALLVFATCAALDYLVPGVVDAWPAKIDAATSGTIEPARARLGLAVTRGLLLDLVATGDDAGVDAAAPVFVELTRQIAER
jgi:hypothetical protein